ncbi:hypothetical protein PAMA_020077 [Pampus argenteus]
MLMWLNGNELESAWERRGWLDLLPLLENKYGVDKCYMFENNVFPNIVTLPPPASQTLPPQSIGWQKVPGVNILAHLHHKPID